MDRSKITDRFVRRGQRKLDSRVTDHVCDVRICRSYRGRNLAVSQAEPSLDDDVYSDQHSQVLSPETSLRERKKMKDPKQTLLGLYRHLESAKKVSTEAEVGLFASKIQELLTKYKIDEAEVRAALLVEEGKSPDGDAIVEKMVPHSGFTKYAGKNSTAEGFPFKQRRTPWSERLASTIAKANYCQILFHEKRNSIWFVGREIEVDTCIQVFLYLAAAAERISWIEYQKAFDKAKSMGYPEQARGFRASFLLGFVSRLGERYDAHWEKMRQEWLKDTKALVSLKDAREAVREHVQKKFSTAKNAEVTIENRDGYYHGRVVGDTVPIEPIPEKLLTEG